MSEGGGLLFAAGTPSVPNCTGSQPRMPMNFFCTGSKHHMFTSGMFGSTHPPYCQKRPQPSFQTKRFSPLLSGKSVLQSQPTSRVPSTFAACGPAIQVHCKVEGSN